MTSFSSYGKVEPVYAQDPAAEMFQLINNFRAELGLPPFTFNPTLASAAQQQANYLTSTNQYTHTGSGGTSPQDRADALGYSGYVVENIVGGWKMTPNQGLTWWINSPVHYNTLVSTRHTQAGTGYAFGNDQHRFALVVGEPAAQRTAASPPPQAVQPAPLIVEPVELAQPAADGSIVHVMGKGQALWTLAAYYEVPLSDLLLFNNLSEDAFVQPGDEVIIRLGEGQEPPPTPTPPPFHVVKEGQTLWTIAAIYDLKLSDLLWLNSLSEGAFIQPGQEIIVRLDPGQAPPPTATPQLTYFVREGDSLWPIAATFGLTLDELLALNGLTADSLLQPGQELVIRRPEPTPHPPTFTPMPTATAVSNSDPISIRDVPAVEPGETATPAAAVALNSLEVELENPPLDSSPMEASAVEPAGSLNTGVILGVLAALIGTIGLMMVWKANRP